MLILPAAVPSLRNSAMVPSVDCLSIVILPLEANAMLSPELSGCFMFSNSNVYILLSY